MRRNTLDCCYSRATLIHLSVLAVLLPTQTCHEVPSCGDEYLDCAERVAGGACLGLALDGKDGFSVKRATKVLSQCRVSCRRFVDRLAREGQLNETMKQLLSDLGGTGDELESLFGSKISICDLNQGWTSMARRLFIYNRHHAATCFKSKEHGPRRHTLVGFEKTRTPTDLWIKIKKMYQTVKNTWTREYCYNPGIFACQSVASTADESRLVNVTTMLSRQINRRSEEMLGKMLLPFAQQWAGGMKLSFHNAYGFRRYVKGGKCEGHVDTYEEKVISAIINVAQDVDGHPWPLDILDYSGKHHRVFMQPGDLVWYESAKVPHGREEIFQGKYFDNIFIHFRPAWYENATSDEIKYPYQHEMGKTKYG